MDFLCFDFINTQWYAAHNPGFEPLRDKTWMEDFSAKWELNAGCALSERQFRQLAELRALLFDIVVDLHTGKGIRDQRLAKFNRYLSLTPLNHELLQEENTYKVVLTPACRDWKYVLYKIASSLAEVITAHGAEKIRVCDNPACRWVFLDNSRNRSRRWCSNTCSSLIKVRKFRESQKSRGNCME
jgi:predicted RNA-binding Zn ribbon-like protein